MKRIIFKLLLFINSTLLIIYMGLEINIQMPVQHQQNRIIIPVIIDVDRRYLCEFLQHQR